MKKLYYYVTVRDKEGNLYKTDKGLKVLDFRFEDTEENESLVQLICEQEAAKYKAITGSENIDIEVRKDNNYLKVKQLVYSYYAREKRFVKHD
jgi:hypothetical protein